jgi:hypothetical protein
LVERRANAFVDPEREWTLAKTLYAVVLFGASFFGWYFSPTSLTPDGDAPRGFPRITLIGNSKAPWDPPVLREKAEN